MTDPTTEFFERLSKRGYEPMVREATATVRFEITQGKKTDRWCLVMDKGNLEVTTDCPDADCVIIVQRNVFNGIASGEVNAMSAFLRGELTGTGNPDLIVLVQRLFPGPPQTRERRPVAAEGGVRHD